MCCVPASLGPRSRGFLLRLLLVADVADGLKVVHRVHPARLEIPDVIHLGGTNLATRPCDLTEPAISCKHTRSVRHELELIAVGTASSVIPHAYGSVVQA